MKLVDQFSKFKEVKKKAKENKTKGPADLKEGRAQVRDWNKGNKKP